MWQLCGAAELLQSEAAKEVTLDLDVGGDVLAREDVKTAFRTIAPVRMLLGSSRPGARFVA